MELILIIALVISLLTNISQWLKAGDRDIEIEILQELLEESESLNSNSHDVAPASSRVVELDDAWLAGALGTKPPAAPLDLDFSEKTHPNLARKV